MKSLATHVARGVFVLALIFLSVLGLRIWESQRGLPLEIWHQHIPEELEAEALDEADWAAYLAREAAIFEAL